MKKLLNKLFSGLLVISMIGVAVSLLVTLIGYAYGNIELTSIFKMICCWCGILFFLSLIVTAFTD